MGKTRTIVLWVCAAAGLILLGLIGGTAIGLRMAWPDVPAVPKDTSEAPPWGSLSAILLEARARGDGEPRLVADATSGSAADGDIRVLALSSGGQYGAFGAGVLSAWAEAGDQPSYDVVTGISAGSILAPIAFLGPSQERTLPSLVQEMAELVDAHPVDVKNPVSLVKAMLGYGFELPVRIQDLVRKMFDAKFIDLIAAEHAMGRKLYVSSTDLTGGRVVIWNLGVIAASDRPDRVQRFQDAVLASFAVPPLFPPVYIETGEAGTYAMHVDGGFPAPFFLSALIERNDRPGGAFHVDVVINNKLEWKGRTAAVPPVIFEAAPRLIAMIYEHQVPSAIDNLLLMSAVYGFKVRVLAIPDDEQTQNPIDFSGREIEALFQLGLRTARKKSAWRTLPYSGIPDYWAPPEAATTGDATRETTD